MNSLKQDWLSNVRNDLLAGLVVALALIPEAIACRICYALPASQRACFAKAEVE